MLDRVAHLPRAPCLLAQDIQLGGIAFYHVNSLCQAIPASRGEIATKTWQHKVNYFFHSYYYPMLSSEQNDSQSEEINVIDESRAENRPVHMQEAEMR